MEHTSQPSSVDPAGQAEDQPAAALEPGPPREVTVRRAPRYLAFVISGVLLGCALGLLAGLLSSGSSETSTLALYGYLAVIAGLLGGAAGAAVALLIERRD
ncbi:MAG: hypothetical protein ACRC0L_03055 [Angustibacter sp.]